MGRTYELKQGQFPSVTTILGILDKSDGLIPWAVNSAIEYIKQHQDGQDLNEVLELARKEWRNVSKEAMDIGSEIHDLIEKYIKHGRDAIGELRPEVENGFLAFLKWEEENVDEWLESEIIIYDPVGCYAGRLDAVARLKDGRVVLIDFKSSKGFYKEYGMQAAAYRNGYEINRLCNLDGEIILRLDKTTGLPEAKDYSKDHETNLNAFLRLTDYWYASAKRRCKNARTLEVKNV